MIGLPMKVFDESKSRRKRFAPEPLRIPVPSSLPIPQSREGDEPSVDDDKPGTHVVVIDIS